MHESSSADRIKFGFVVVLAIGGAVLLVKSSVMIASHTSDPITFFTLRLKKAYSCYKRARIFLLFSDSEPIFSFY